MNENIIFIISPPRSGSKLLRDTLASSDKISCIEFDINFVWTRNHLVDDEISKEYTFDPFIKQFIFRHKQKSSDFIIDKTVSNCLRLGYIEKNFEGCKYIFLGRNRVDTIKSLQKCWRLPSFSKENQSRNIYIKKILKFPYRHCWQYGFEYLKNSLKRILNQESLVSTWGPRFSGINDYLKENGINKTCEKQFFECDSKIRSFKKTLNCTRYISINYEDLISNPNEELKKISEFLKQDISLNSWKQFANEKYRL